MQNEKRTFVKLCKLQDITFAGATAEQQADWIDNVTSNVGTEGYGLAGSEDYTTAEFGTDEIEFASVDCYNFMGTGYERERFYIKDAVTVREKATGDFYAYETDSLYEV